MLKAFVPNYDIPTGDNAHLARHVFSEDFNMLIGEAATRESLLSLIALPDTTALFLMSHGNHDCVCDQTDGPGLNLSDIKNNVNNILRLPIFAWVCKTALGLGPSFHRRAQKGQGTWWGYRTTISAPSRREISAFKGILEYIIDGFPDIHTVDSGKTFLIGLKELCETHRSRVVFEMSMSSIYEDAHETAVAFRELYEHLEGWLPADPQPIHAACLDVVVQEI
jgi:hypothetical protein